LVPSSVMPSSKRSKWNHYTRKIASVSACLNFASPLLCMYNPSLFFRSTSQETCIPSDLLVFF
jgi:hypothetical protein